MSDYSLMTELEFVNARIGKLRQVLLEREPGVQSVNMNGMSVSYYSIENELHSLMTKRAALLEPQGNLFKEIDLSGAY